MQLQRSFEYNHWANSEEVDRLVAIASPPEHAIRLLAHIIGAERLWLGRLQGVSSPLAVWPSLTIDDCRREIENLHGMWTAYLPAAPLDSKIQYVNSKGESWTSPVDDVLTHVVIHGGYHRGQIAMAVREAGSEPAYTDYIHYTRSASLRRRDRAASPA